jgi:hypothetical protein
MFDYACFAAMDFDIMIMIILNELQHLKLQMECMKSQGPQLLKTRIDWRNINLESCFVKINPNLE